MDERPVTRYAKTPDGVTLAYQVFGEGPLDLIWIPGFAYPLEVLWDEPDFAHFAKRLRGFSRTLWYEGTGMGASAGGFLDRALAEKVDGDLMTLVNTFESERVVLVGWGHVGSFAISYAAAHPERVSALVLIDTYAHYSREADYPVGFPPDALEQSISWIRENWGTGTVTAGLAPTKSEDLAFRERIGRCERLGASPDQAAEAVRIAYLRDVRAVLPRLSVPTLVLHRGQDLHIRRDAGQYLAEHIPGAKYVELPGEDFVFFAGDVDAVLDEIEEFLTGGHQAPEGDVVTATILFTDIVSSTEQSARMGHRRWTKLTDDHDAMVRATLLRHRGREVKTIGDGFLATFDATTRAVRAAMEIVAAAKTMGLDVRAGVHTGEVEVRPDDVVGLTVSIAKRICNLAGAGEVFVSEAVKALITGSDIVTSERGTHVLKGVPDEWRLYGIESR